MYHKLEHIWSYNLIPLTARLFEPNLELYFSVDLYETIVRIITFVNQLLIFIYSISTIISLHQLPKHISTCVFHLFCQCLLIYLRQTADFVTICRYLTPSNCLIMHLKFLIEKLFSRRTHFCPFRFIFQELQSYSLSFHTFNIFNPLFSNRYDRIVYIGDR